MQRARSIMVQGTASHVGKSVLVTALCRIFAQDGYRVAPFKSQNMALNSFVTVEGGEIGRAQAVQAEAAGQIPSTWMNPILIKPSSDTGAQVILHGKVLRNMSAAEYHAEKKRLEAEVLGAYRRLAETVDIVVLEGAGSPAEVNLRHSDIVNMRMAQLAQAPVIITADIDKGGSFAALVGTMELLTPDERRMVKALHINKFRGDVEILRPGLEFLTQKCGRPLLGVTPYIRDIGIQEEDSLPTDRINRGEKKHPAALRVQIPALPHLSNFTDFDPLEAEEAVELKYLRPGEPFHHPDLIILPGTKNTIEDLRYLEENGYVRQIKKLQKQGVLVLGICGGYQMLGREVLDPGAAESSAGRIDGLNLLHITTCFEPAKITAQVQARALELPFFQGRVAGYEIHMGRTQLSATEQALFSVRRRGCAEHLDGAASSDYKVMGTYLHGLFDNDGFRRAYLNFIRRQRGLQAAAGDPVSSLGLRQAAYERLARVVRDSLDMDLLYKILGSGV